jgi:hypothetical protein
LMVDWLEPLDPWTRGCIAAVLPVAAGHRMHGERHIAAVQLYRRPGCQ